MNTKVEVHCDKAVGLLGLRVSDSPPVLQESPQPSFATSEGCRSLKSWSLERSHPWHSTGHESSETCWSIETEKR